MGGTHGSIEVTFITVDWDKNPPLGSDAARESLRVEIEKAALAWYAANPGELELEPMVW